MSQPAGTFASEPYTAQLSVLHPRADESYRLVVFASRDGHHHAAFNEVVVLSKPEERFSFNYTVDKGRRSRWIHFLLFMNSSDEHGIHFQSLLAWGKIDTMNTEQCTVSLVDVKQKAQATLHATPRRPRTESILPALQTTEDLSQSMIASVRGVYSELSHSRDSYLNWVVTPMGKVPLLPFVASVSCILTASPVDQERGEEFIVHQFDLAKSNLGLEHKEWEGCTLAEKSKWLTEAVTLIPRSMIYEQDLVRVSKDHHEPADQWVRVLSFPEPNIASFDCEDSAIFCLEMMYLIQHLNFQSAQMKQVQRFCASYTACFIFGSLKIAEKYCPHAYAALLDSSFLDGSRSGEHAASIIFEGTARLGGAWSHDKSSKASDDSFDVHSTILSSLGSGKGYGRVLRNETSLQFAQKHGIYGRVYGVISGDHRGKDAVHLLPHIKSSNSIGVEPGQLFGYDSQVALKVAASYSDSANSKFTQLCNELPRSHIPFVGTSKNQFYKTRGEFYVAMHYETYLNRQEAVQGALKDLRSSFKITSQILHVTDQLKLQQFWFQSLLSLDRSERLSFLAMGQ